MESMIEVSVGDAIPPRVVEDVDAAKMKTMAALLHDPNPIHWDVDAVARLGMGDRPVNQGPSNMGYIVNALVEFAGDARTVRNVNCRFNGNVFADDRLEAGGEVTAVHDTDDGRVVECDVWLTRDGDRVVTGTARLVWDHHLA